MEKRFKFNHYDKILVRDEPHSIWQCQVFSHYEKMNGDEYAVCLGDAYACSCHEIIPYEGNECLAGNAKPYEPLYEKGDFVALTKNHLFWVGIYNAIEDDLIRIDHVLAIHRNNDYADHLYYPKDVEIRYAFKEEKQLLLDKLHEQGKDWDAEKCEVVDCKWRPNEGDYYYMPFFEQGEFIVKKYPWTNNGTDNIYLAKGWVFKTEKECQALCDKLDGVISKVEI